METKTRIFRDIREEYDHLFRSQPIRDEDRGYEWLARQVLNEKPDAQCLLDLACGGGYFLRQLASFTPRETPLVGLDISPQAIRIARQECPQARYLVGVGESLPFAPETFDAITCWGSLEHFLDIEEAIQEMKRVASPEARFFILVPNLFWYKDILSVFFTGNRKTRNQMHERFAALGEWSRLLEGLGLEVLKTRKYNGIARNAWKQRLKDLLIPLRVSYHFLFICSHRERLSRNGRIAEGSQ